MSQSVVSEAKLLNREKKKMTREIGHFFRVVFFLHEKAYIVKLLYEFAERL